MQDDVELKELFGSNEIMTMPLSYSRISDFDRNGSKALLQKSFIENDGAKIGSITDDLLFNENNFHKIYYRYDGSKPTATHGKLADIILKNYKSVPNKEELFKIVKKNKFWTNIVDENVLSNKVLDPDFISYINAQYMSKTKTLITTEEWMLGNELRDILLIHDNSKHIFKGECELHSQVEFKFVYKGFTLRGVIDIVLIDHENKTIRMIDLKTGSNSLLEFMNSFIKWRYFLQEAVYMKSAKTVQNNLKIKNYKLLPFQFLYISRYEKIPFIFEIGSKWHNAALNGFKTTNNYEYKGLNALLDEIKWHLNNKVFDLPKEIYEANGFMELKDDFIILK